MDDDDGVLGGRPGPAERGDRAHAAPLRRDRAARARRGARRRATACTPQRTRSGSGRSSPTGRAASSSRRSPMLLAAEGADRSEHLRRQLALLDASDGRPRRAATRPGRRHWRRVRWASASTPRRSSRSSASTTRRSMRRRRTSGGATPTPTVSRTAARRPTRSRTGCGSREESDAVEAELAACLAAGEPADGARAKAAAEAHRRHIDTWFYPCSYEMQVGAGGHVRRRPAVHARTTTTIAAGLAEYVRDAIIANALDRIA